MPAGSSSWSTRLRRRPRPVPWTTWAQRSQRVRSGSVRTPGCRCTISRYPTPQRRMPRWSGPSWARCSSTSGDRSAVEEDHRRPIAPDTPGGTAGSVEAFVDDGHALAAADAHGFQAEGGVAFAESVEQGGGDPGPGHAVRVADGDAAAVHVELVDVDAQSAVAGDGLRGER